MTRRPPGGIWFFILAGLVGVFVVYAAEKITGGTIRQIVTVSGSAFFSTLVSIVGLYTAGLEHRHNKQIYLSENGFYWTWTNNLRRKTAHRNHRTYK